MADLTQREVDAIYALRHAADWIGSAPHGDNCFVSDHYPGDPGNRCNCGKESAEQAVQNALTGYPESMDDDGEPLEVSAAPAAPKEAQEPSRNWWCPYCACEVPPEHVTFGERHDPRHGGCDSGVLAERPASRAASPAPSAPAEPAQQTQGDVSERNAGVPAPVDLKDFPEITRVAGELAAARGVDLPDGGQR